MADGPTGAGARIYSRGPRPGQKKIDSSMALPVQGPKKYAGAPKKIPGPAPLVLSMFAPKVLCIYGKVDLCSHDMAAYRLMYKPKNYIRH